MACTCANNTGLVFQTGSQVFGTTGVINCDGGEDVEYLYIQHNGQSVINSQLSGVQQAVLGAALGSTNTNPIPMGSGTIGFANGTVSMANVPPGQYQVVFGIDVDGAELICGHTITVQSGNTGNLCNNFSTSCPVGGSVTVTPGQVQQGATGFTSPTSDIIDSESDPSNATSVTGVTTTSISISCDQVGTTQFGIKMQDGSVCPLEVEVTSGGGNGTGSCTCANNSGLVFQTGSQVFGFANVINCQGGEDLEYLYIIHNGQSVINDQLSGIQQAAIGAALGSTNTNPIPMGSGTIGFANGTVSMANVPPGQYQVEFGISVNGDELVCGHTITVQSGGNGNLCNGYSQTINVGQSVTVTPGQVQQGATGFSSNPSNIVQGENDPNNATSVTGVTSSGITISGNSVGTTIFTVGMQDGSTCDFTINVQSGTGGSNCGSMSGFSIAANQTTSLNTVTLGLSSSCSIVSGSWVGGNGSATVQAQVDNTLDVTPANGTTSGTLVVVVNCGGSNETCNGWPVTVSSTNQALACLGGTLGPFFAGQSVQVSQLVTGGVSPFVLNGTPSGAVSGSSGQPAITVNGTLTPGTHSATVPIRDATGATVNCSIVFTVADSACTEEVSGTTVSPANPAAGAAVTLSTTGCTCPGFVVRWENAASNPTTVALSNNGEGNTVTYTHPLNASSGQQWCFTAKCCPE